MVPRTPSLVLLCGLLAGCTLIDVRTDPDKTGIRSDAFIDAFATVGWAEDPSFLEIQLLGGRSRGALFMLDLWYLARLEIGLLGASVGLGPLDVGFGLLFYSPRSPAAGDHRQHLWEAHHPRAEDEPGEAPRAADERTDVERRADDADEMEAELDEALDDS